MTKKGGTMKEEILAAIQAISEKIRQLETAKRALEELLDSGPLDSDEKARPRRRTRNLGQQARKNAQAQRVRWERFRIRRANWPLRLPSITIDVTGQNWRQCGLENLFVK